MGIVKNNETQNNKKIRVSKDRQDKVKEIIDNQSKLYISLGMLQSDYENNKMSINMELNELENTYTEFLESLEKEFGKGELNIENWTYIINK